MFRLPILAAVAFIAFSGFAQEAPTVIVVEGENFSGRG